MKKHVAASFLLLCTIILSLGTLASPAYAASPACTTLTIGLAVGSTNAQVTQLQDFLRAEGYFATESTGYFGQVTFRAVSAFQVAQNIPSIGSVGPLTRAAIQKVSCTPPPAPAPVPAPAATSTAQAAAVAMAIPPAAPASISLPYNPNSFAAWTGTWGNATTSSSGTLLISANASTTGAEAILPLSNAWTDYRYTANVTVQNGDITLISRYTDDDNFVSCTFSNNWVDIQERINGVNTDLGSITLTNMSSSPVVIRATAVGMDVKGDTVGCSALGPSDNITATLSPGTLAQGGIGIETWFDGPNTASLELESAQVTAL